MSGHAPFAAGRGPGPRWRRAGGRSPDRCRHNAARYCRRGNGRRSSPAPALAGGSTAPGRRCSWPSCNGPMPTRRNRHARAGRGRSRASSAADRPQPSPSCGSDPARHAAGSAAAPPGCPSRRSAAAAAGRRTPWRSARYQARKPSWLSRSAASSCASRSRVHTRRRRAGRWPRRNTGRPTARWSATRCWPGPTSSRSPDGR